MLRDFHCLNLRTGLATALLMAGGCADADSFQKLTKASVAAQADVLCNNDGECTGDENPVTCPADCAGGMGVVCGDGECDPGETVLTCPGDCTEESCGNGECDDEETEASCPADCGDRDCGDAVCGEGENVDNCPADCDIVCGDSICSDPNENRANCGADCCDHIVVDPATTGTLYQLDEGDQAVDGDEIDYYFANIGNHAGGPQDERVRIAFYRDGRERFGTSDLTTVANSSWRDCEQCVHVLEDGEDAKPFFQVGGGVTVGGNRPSTGVANVRLEGVTLRQANPDTGEAVTDADATCYYVDGAELRMPQLTCGDRVCSLGEECPADCTVGNGTCDPGESDAADCFCGNGRCDLHNGESKMNCAQDCCEFSATEGAFDDLAPGQHDPEAGFFFYGKTFDEDLSGGIGRERIEVQFYGGANEPSVPGTPQVWDLGTGENDNYETCKQCVLVLEDWSVVGDRNAFRANYFQRSGRLEVRTEPSSGGTDVTLHDTVLVESIIDWNPQVCDENGDNCQGGPDGSYASQPVDMARCYYLDNVSLKTP